MYCISSGMCTIATKYENHVNLLGLYGINNVSHTSTSTGNSQETSTFKIDVLHHLMGKLLHRQIWIKKTTKAISNSKDLFNTISFKSEKNLSKPQTTGVIVVRTQQ
uniref:Uncharacterized protein n=1 Tax=Opuntia streptacantha TaxID=393608 RepID=A0A7C9DKI5_OPUST